MTIGDASVVVALDPGVRGCGLAVAWRSSQRLAFAAYARSPVRKGSGAAESVASAMEAFRAFCDWRDRSPIFRPDVVVEWPQIYRGSVVDPNAMLSLAGVSTAFAALANGTTYGVLPREWKGNVKADECTLRIRAAITSEEHARIEFPNKQMCDACRQRGTQECEKPSCVAHNIFDSIGLAFWASGRLF